VRPSMTGPKAPGALASHRARRVLRRDRRGSSSPVVVETDLGPFLLKLRGAAQGPAALVAEIIVGSLADVLGLAVPARCVITLDADTPTDDRNDELADLLAASVGENLGFQFLPGARPFGPHDGDLVGEDWAAQVRWLDWLVMNPDRTAGNPNILVEGKRLWLIDHGAALPFQHDWTAVTEETPVRPAPRVTHLFDAMAQRFGDWDPILTALVGRERLEEIVAGVPDSFLAPLVGPAATGVRLARRRAAYVAFLWKRLQGPRLVAPPR
jgi:HipA-like protein